MKYIRLLAVLIFLTSSTVSFAVQYLPYGVVACESSDTIYTCADAIEGVSISFSFIREWRWHEYSLTFNSSNQNQVSIYFYETPWQKHLVGTYNGTLLSGGGGSGMNVGSIPNGHMQLTVPIDGINFYIWIDGRTLTYPPQTTYKSCIQSSTIQYDCYSE
jgi:hypothetical protein